MNCEDFKQIVDELAEYKPMQATVRDAGVSHVALCADCAAKLANARAVSSGLLLAASAESETAPSIVKANLLTAFADLQQTKSARANVVDISSRRRPVRWIAATAAIAAVILLAVSVSIWRKGFAPNSPESPRVAMVAPTPAPPTSIVDQTPLAPVHYRSLHNTPRRQRIMRQVRPDSGIYQQPNETVAWNTGEYLPLTYLATATAMDSGTVVRVELSRSALASLGFPVNGDGGSESVKAEVILGDDGVARAIRLVQ